ncbi:MAG: ribbon-helix-helix protein, CopG family [Candidatus Diapherotrites archaeon]|uniref:Ribbon-helix-helix protein, CopG family n=1 Tax=Candidatus Iainarchaeum sp. TaxID=3101447 RepID=A0A8T4C7H4_9ARCH|nr:ribbon-helix-helix protein, CopG family [Candidatus Diapherotrites archaeon]
MKMLSVQVEDSFVQQIDEAIAVSGSYSSRSEFLKDAIRKAILEWHERAANRKLVHEVFREFGKKALAKGWDGSLLTREERIKIADEYMKEKRRARD